jgi:GT2 family glycosyltransferase
LEKALPWFQDSRVAAVCARVVPSAPKTLADRWRARHLFLSEIPTKMNRRANLATTCAILRRSAVISIGNFNTKLRHTEDGDLGERLLAQSYEVIFDPSLIAHPLTSNSILKVLERHWRWYAGIDENLNALGYIRSIIYSIKVMAKQDLRQRDWGCAVISLTMPHHHFLLTCWNRCLRILNKFKI